MNAWLRQATSRLKAAGIDGAVHDARMLLQEIAEISLTDRLLRGDEILSTERTTKLERALERRCQREPLNYITGRGYFRDLILHTPPYVLTPRPDSEALIDVAIECAPVGENISILDLGCGTGCLSLALLKEWPGSTAIAVDRDPRLAQLASDNARLNGLHHQFFALCADWDRALKATFDVIISNPPYIPRADLDNLEPEVSTFEPALALDGGDDGLDFYRRLLTSTSERMHDESLMILELGFDQFDALKLLLIDSPLTLRSAKKDLSGHVRAVVLEPKHN